MPSLQILQGPEDVSAQMNNQIAGTLGQGLGNFITHRNANKALEKVLSDPNLKGAPVSQVLDQLTRALSPYGEVGQGILSSRLGIEQQKMQEQQQSSLAKAFEHYQKGEDIPENVSKNLTPEALMKFQEAGRARKIGQNFYDSGIKTGMPEELAAYHRDTISNLRQGEGMNKAIDDFVKDMSRYKELSGKDLAGGKVPLNPTERVKREEIGLKDTEKARQQLAQKADYAQRGIANKKFALNLVQGDEKLDDPLYVEFANRLPGGIRGKILSPKTQLYQAGLFDEFGVLKSMFPGQVRVKEIELLEDKLATLDKSDQAKKAILEHGIKKLEYDIILANAGAQVEKENPGAGSLEFNQLVQEKAKPQLDALYDELIKGYRDIFAEHAKPQPGHVFLVDENNELYEIPIGKVNEIKAQHPNLKERK